MVQQGLTTKFFQIRHENLVLLFFQILIDKNTCGIISFCWFLADLLLILNHLLILLPLSR